MRVILVTLLKNKLQDFPPIANHCDRKFITIWQGNKLSPSCQICEKPAWDFTIIVKVILKFYKMTRLCYHIWNKINKMIHRTPLEKEPCFISSKSFMYLVLCKSFAIKQQHWWLAYLTNISIGISIDH